MKLPKCGQLRNEMLRFTICFLCVCFFLYLLKNVLYWDQAGLGRTGVLIGCYLMKNFRFTANEVCFKLLLL